MERPATAAAPRPADEELDRQIANVLKEGASLMALQREAVEFIVRNPRCILADDMGLGKTLVTLVALGVLAQRCAGRRKRFRVLLAAYNRVNIGSWMNEINKFLRPGFFATQVLQSNSEKLLNAERLIVFTTYARMRNCFNDALGFIPPDAIQPAERRKRGRSGSDAPPTAADPTSAGAVEDQADDPDLLDALLAEHGFVQTPGKQAATGGAPSGEKSGSADDDEDEARGSQIKRNFATHRMDHVATRRQLFQASGYWEGRVDANSWLPCAPLLSPCNKDDGRPPMFYVSWEAIVFDEGHECKDLKAAQTKAALFLDYSEAALWVTGTVTQNRLAEARSSLLMVRDASVCCELGVMRDGQGTELKGEAAQEARVLKALQRVAFRRTAADLVRDKPDVLASDARTSYLINTSIRRGVIKRFFQSAKERELHNKYVRNMRKVAERLVLTNAEKKKGGLLPPAKRSSGAVDEDGEASGAAAAEDKEEGITGGNAELLKSYTRALQVCSAASVIDAEGERPEDSDEFDTHSTKMNMLVEQLSKFPKGEKVIIFDHRVKVLRVAMRRLLTMGINSVLFASDVSDSVKENGIANWKRPRSGVDILLAQTKIAGTTHTWIESHIVIHLSPPINPAIEDQSNYRTYRPGQTQDVIVIILVIAGSIEELALEIQTRKREDNKAYMSGAEVATRTKERIKINAEEALRHAEMILNNSGGGGTAPAAAGASSSARHGEHSTAVRGVPAYRECNTFEEDEQLNHIRKLFHGPDWVTEELMKSGKVYFLDPGRSYSDAGILPRGSLIMSVASSARAHAREMSHCAERTRLRAEAANPTGSTFTTAARGKKHKSSAAPPSGVVGVAAEAGPRSVRVALCPVSLYVLLKSEVFDELEQLGRSYIEKRSGQARLAARAGGAGHRPLVTSHTSGFFPVLSPPVVSAGALMDPDRIGEAYTTLVKLRGNPALSAKASYDLQNLNTPAEIASALRDFFAPQFAVIHPIDHQLQRGKHLQDTYHVANRPNGPIELIGPVAATLTEPTRNVFLGFQLDPDVLLSFSPMWHESGMELHNRLSAPPPPPRRDQVDLYEMANEGLRKKLHWVNADAIREPINARDGMLFQRYDFSPQAYKDVLLPLLHEAASPGCSKNVRTMATAALCAYALTGCSKSPVYLIASHDTSNKVQGLFVATKSAPSTLVGAAVYLRSPNDAQTRDVFRRTVLGNLMRDTKITKLVNAQELIAPMEYDRSWCRTARKVGQPVTYGDASSSIAWGAYSQGYQSYHREPAAAIVPPLSSA